VKDKGWLHFQYIPRVTLKLRDVDIKDIVRVIAMQTGKNIIIAPDVQGKVTITLNNIPWEIALEAIVKTLGFVVVKEEYDILRIVKPETLKAQLETKVFQLKYLRPPDPYKAKFPTGTTGGGGGGTGGAAATTTGIECVAEQPVTEEAFTILKVLRNVLTQGVGQLQYDPKKNTIIVTDTKPKLTEIEQIIKQLDVAPLQVRIEVKFIRTTTRDFLEHGFRWAASSSGDSGPVLSAYFRQANDEGIYKFDLGRWESIRDNFKVIGVLDFTESRIMLRMFESDENSQVVQMPTLIALDNAEAVIFVGERVPYAKSQATQDQLGNIVTTYTEADKSPISVGFTLYVTPHIIEETGEIQLTVIPKTSTLTGQSSPVKGFERFGTPPYAIDLPRTLDQTMITQMVLKNSATAVLGGLLTRTVTETEQKVPLFGNLPLVGFLFRWKEKDARVENLIIFITPYLIRTSEDHLTMSEERLRILKRVDYFYSRYRAGIAYELDELLSAERTKLETEKREREEKRRKQEEERKKEQEKQKKEGEKTTPEPPLPSPSP
jgi:type II secretory pathway component GspD/PulD (secretin)